jgi:excisionase family DNA binding protein
MTTDLPPDAERSSRQLLGVRDLARRLNCSERHVWRLADSGAMPAPVRLGALVRWNVAVIKEWIDGGCRPVRRPGKGA